MTLTLLLDLDDTLLSNQIGTFLPAYLQALGNYLAAYAPPGRLVQALLAATHKMILNNQPDCRLKDIFEANFYPAIGLTEKDLQEPINKFYKEVFPSLQPLTQYRAEAVKLVEEAFTRGYQIAIATSPLFPLTAIHQRLDWAGLPADKYPFRLITSYETSHFAKPNPAYYSEVLGRLGWPEGPVIMVGDDLENDIEPALQAGLAAFRITNNGNTSPVDSPHPTASGELADFFPWLDSTDQAELTPTFRQPRSLIHTLRASPAALANLTAEIPKSHWIDRPFPGEWSLTEILCHLRDADHEVNLPRMKTVLHEFNPFLVGMDTDSWAVERLYNQQDGPTALHDFTHYRMEILHILDHLSPKDWDRPARHAIFGPTRLEELVSIAAGHDRLHLRQVYATLNSIQRANTFS